MMKTSPIPLDVENTLPRSGSQQSGYVSFPMMEDHKENEGAKGLGDDIRESDGVRAVQAASPEGLFFSTTPEPVTRTSRQTAPLTYRTSSELARARSTQQPHDRAHRRDTKPTTRSTLTAATTSAISFIKSLLTVTISKFSFSSLSSSRSTKLRPSSQPYQSIKNPMIPATPRPLPPIPTHTISGQATDLKKILQSHGVDTPPVALLKALVINGVFDLRYTGGVLNTEDMTLGNSLIVPNQDVEGATFCLSRSLINHLPNESKLLGNIQIPTTYTIPISIPHSTTTTTSTIQTQTLKATLVYPTVSTANHNDVTLLVRAQDGTQCYGTTGSSFSLEEVDNVAQLVWRGVPAGDAKIKVVCAKGTRGWVVVWRLE